MAVPKENSKYSAVFDAIDRAPTVMEAVVLVKDAYGFDHATYHLTPVGAGMDAPYVKSTYSDQWLSRYLMRGYVRVDPVVREGLQRQLPFFWHEVTMTADAVDLMTDAFTHGLGGSGYTVPVVDKLVRKALFSVNSRMESSEWQAHIRLNATDLSEVANKLHRKAVMEIFGKADPVPQLGPREIEVLHWTAQGKDFKAIAILIGISEFTVRAYMVSLRNKLDCSTLAQAVAKAMKLGLIDK